MNKVDAINILEKLKSKIEYFLMDYRKDSFFYISKNIDRISFILSFYLVIYLKKLQKLSKMNIIFI